MKEPDFSNITTPLVRAVREAEEAIGRQFERALQMEGADQASLNALIVRDPRRDREENWIVSTIPWKITIETSIQGEVDIYYAIEIQLFRKLKKGGLGAYSWNANMLYDVDGPELCIGGYHMEGSWYRVVGRLSNVAGFNLTAARRHAEFIAQREAFRAKAFGHAQPSEAPAEAVQ